MLSFLLPLLGSCSLLLSSDSPKEDAGTPEGDATTTLDCDCSSQAPYCGSDGICYAECVDLPPDGQGAACAADTPERPLCARRGCVECTVHSDCPESEICDVIAGMCTRPLNLFAVEEDANGLGCTLAAPCGTITQAISAAKALKEIAEVTIVVFPGDYPDEQISVDSGNIRLIAFDATLIGEARVQIVSGGTLTIEGLASTADPVGNNLEIVECLGNSTLTLREVRLEESDERAINVETCAKLTVSRSVIRRNVSGLRVFQTPIDVSNSLFVESRGGAALDLLLGARGRLILSTVDRNGSATDGVNGVRCQSPFNVELSGNAVSDETDAACIFTHSVVVGRNGEGVIAEDPVLDDDHRPTMESPGLDQDSIQTLVAPGDRDHGLVPRDSPPDMGAYEF